MIKGYFQSLGSAIKVYIKLKGLNFKGFKRYN